MTHGLAGLMEEVATAARPGLADDLWRLVYTRNHIDVDRARPYLDRDHAGMLVYARALDRKRALADRRDRRPARRCGRRRSARAAGSAAPSGLSRTRRADHDAGG